MAERAIEQFADMHITARIGTSDTKGTAWALARYLTGQSAPIAISKPSQAKSDLQNLPVEALNIGPKISADLRRIGLKTIGQLYTIKSGELARRFGLELTQALSKALGQAPDPVSPMAADPVYAARMNLPDPIGLKDDLAEVLRRLTESICTRLEADRVGARQFHLTVRCVDTGDHVISIGFARPCFNAGQVRRQFERPLDKLIIKFGADWFRLVADTLEPIRERPRKLMGIMGGEAEEAAEDLSQVITTLGNRLGFDRIRRFAPRDSQLPEAEFTTIEAADCHAEISWTNIESQNEGQRQRPLRLFRPERLSTLIAGRPPKAFEWRKARYVTLRALGPERLASEWWQYGRATLKDYWAVETESGDRLWLMTYPAHKEPNWFITGRFL
jgi:protein ImuB